MKKNKLPIFLELTLGALIIIIAILGVYTVVQLFSFKILSNKYEKGHLANRYKEVLLLAKNVDVEISEKAFSDYLNQVSSEEFNEYIRIYSDEKVIYEASDNIWSKVKYDYSVDDMKIDTKIIWFDIYRVLSGPITINNVNYNIQIIQEKDMFKELMEGYLPVLIVVGILAIALSVAGAMYVSKKFLKRIKNLTDTMNEIKDKGIKQRAEISEMNDEFDKVNMIFNSMMDEVEDTFDEQRRFVSDASHELKTPLTALQGHLNLIKRWGKNDKDRLEKSIDICLVEVDRLKKISHDMLLLSKMENTTLNLEAVEAIDPTIILQDVIQYYKILKSNIKYTISIEDNLKIRIIESDLKQLLIIFIDNAIKYNNKDEIEIDIKIISINNKVKISIKDNGMGIPMEDINNVMKRFYKVDKARVNNNSFGLGLSIAQRVVNNYNGEITISSEVDKFTEISIII